MKIVKKVGLALLVIFILMQFYRPEKNISQGNHTAVFLTQTNPSEEVRLILIRTCYDCHSDNTEYPWYDNIAPISYWLANHVKNGKGHLNFSIWDEYDMQKKDHKLEEVIEMVEKNEMPLKEYTWIHKEALLTEKQRQAVVDWAERTRILYRLDQRPE